MDYAGNIRYRWQNLHNVGDVYNFWYHFDDGYLAVMPVQTSPTAYYYIPSYHYQARDHQGNIRVVVDEVGNLEQKNEYFAYGGPWVSSTNQGFQPFKYNGKELDRVHGLDWYDYGARRYDPAYCLFTQMDPLAEKYPHLNPYVYCAGNPVRYVDPDGQRIFIVSDKNYLLSEDGKIYDNNKVVDQEVLPSYVKDVITAFRELNKSETGNALVAELINSNNDFFIQNGDNNEFKQHDLIAAVAHNNEIIEVVGAQKRLDGSGGTITWNPSIEEGGMDEFRNVRRPPYIGLAHEMYHAKDANHGTLFLNNSYEGYNPYFKGIYKAEWRAVYGENIIRKELKIPMRRYYNSMHPLGPRMIKKGRPINYP